MPIDDPNQSVLSLGMGASTTNILIGRENIPIAIGNPNTINIKIGGLKIVNGAITSLTKWGYVVG